jgi:hypothetical protein
MLGSVRIQASAVSSLINVLGFGFWVLGFGFLFWGQFMKILGAACGPMEYAE